MQPLFTSEELENATCRQMLPLRCKQCDKIFYIDKHQILCVSNKNHKNKGEYCSRKCRDQGSITKINMKCTLCGKKFNRIKSQSRKSKNNFCSRSCAATYNNTHKKHGTRRSKLEIWLEKQLSELYPDIHIDFNKKDTINSELDIYIPSLSLAFELNGIFHYEPIYGQKKLSQIQNNDQRKYQACIEKNIELCLIDTSYQKHFKPKTAQKFIDIITSILNLKLSTS